MATLGEFLPTPNTKLLCRMNGSSVNSIGNISSTDTNMSYGYSYGRYNQGANFNGTNSYIYLGTSSNYNPSNMTINAWVNVSSLSVNRNIISRDNTASKRSYLITISTDGSFFATIFTINSISTGIVNVTGATGAITTGKWNMITFTYDGSTAKLFLNGNLYGSSSCSAIYPQSVETYIGKRRVSDNTEAFSGNIDEVLIENYGWTDDKVKKYYTNSLGRYAIL